MMTMMNKNMDQKLNNLILIISKIKRITVIFLNESQTYTTV